MPSTNLDILSLASSTRDICCGMSSKLDLSVNENRNKIPSARSLHACKRMNYVFKTFGNK